MFCRECGATMYIDDKGYRFKGNYDNYWECPNCKTSCVEEVRYSKTQKELWHSENEGVKDEIVKYDWHSDKITCEKQ